MRDFVVFASDLEVLGDLEAADGCAAAPGDLLEPALRGLEQFAALAPTLVAEPGIEADHLPLSGEVRAGYLGDLKTQLRGILLWH